MPQTIDSRARKYRSRKQQPCDNCRRRRTCCIRQNDGKCALCTARGVACTFLSRAQARRARPPSTSFTGKPATNSTQNSPVEKQLVQASSEPGLEYVGLSGPDDPYFITDCDATTTGDDFRNFRERRQSGTDLVTPVHFKLSKANSAREPMQEVLDDQVHQYINMNWSAIISTYFDAVHPSFPILDQSRAELYSQSFLLKTVIATLTDPFRVHGIGIDIDNLVELLHRNLLLETIKPTLETVEAALLFVQMPIRAKGPSLSQLWIILGTIVGMSHILGLNIDCASWTIDECEKKRRKRLWWAIFTQEKWFAMTLGRPSYLTDDHANVPMATISDFQVAKQSVGEYSAPAKDVGAYCFIAFAELSLILANLLQSFYTINALLRLREADAGQIICIADKIQADLRQWWSKHLEPLLTQRSFPDITGNIELAYLTIEIMLYRALIPKLCRRHLPLEEYLNHSKRASLAVVELVESLQISRLRTFWWSTSGLNFALNGTFMVNMMRMTSDKADVAYWRGGLNFFLELLNAHSLSFQPARLAISALKLVIQSLQKDQGRRNSHKSPRAMSAGDEVPAKPDIVDESSESITNRPPDSGEEIDNPNPLEFDLGESSTQWDFAQCDKFTLNDLDFNDNYWLGEIDTSDFMIGLQR